MAKTFEDFMRERREWSWKQFGTPAERGPLGPLDHLKKEIQEFADSGGRDMMELVDICFLGLDIVERAVESHPGFLELLWEKLEINKARKWGPNSPDGAVEYVRDEESRQDDRPRLYCSDASCGRAYYTSYAPDRPFVASRICRCGKPLI